MQRGDIGKVEAAQGWGDILPDAVSVFSFCAGTKLPLPDPLVEEFQEPNRRAGLVGTGLGICSSVKALLEPLCCQPGREVMRDSFPAGLSPDFPPAITSLT